MKIEILPEDQADLDDGYWFYENQTSGLGEYFLTSLTSDIKSLQLFAGIPAKYLDLHRMLASRFPYSVFYIVSENAVKVYGILLLPPHKNNYLTHLKSVAKV